MPGILLAMRANTQSACDVLGGVLRRLQLAIPLVLTGILFSWTLYMKETCHREVMLVVLAAEFTGKPRQSRS